MTVSLIVLLVIAILLLVLRPPLREHLTATAEIKAPPYDQGEKDRIVHSVPGLLDEYRGLYNVLAPAAYEMGTWGTWWGSQNGNVRDGHIVNDLAAAVGKAYTEVYTPATEPLNTTSFDRFVDTLPDPLAVNGVVPESGGPTTHPAPTKAQVRRLRLRVLKTYFNATAPPPSATGATGGTGPAKTLPNPTALATENGSRWKSLIQRAEFAAPNLYSDLLWNSPYRQEREEQLRQRFQEAYDELYLPSTTPITDADIDSFVTRWYSEYTQSRRDILSSIFKSFFLYNDTSSPTGGAAPTGPTGTPGASGLPVPNAFTIAGESPYSATETNRISTLSPAATAAMKAAYLRASAAGATDDQVAIELARFIGSVYTSVYAGATAAITQAQIKAYVDRTAWSGLTIDDRAKLVELAVLYFGATRTPVATGTTGATGGTGTTTASTPPATTAPTPRTWRTDGSGMTIPTQVSSISTMRESPYSETETKRIAALSPRAKSLVEKGYANVTPPDGITKEQLVERFLATQVAKFYENYYATLQTPLTLELIGMYVDQTYPSSSDANKQAYKELLQRYFIQTGQVNRTDSAFTELDANTDNQLSRDEFNQYMPGGQGGGGGGGGGGTGAAGGSAPITNEFERHIQGYRTALVNYKLTGNTSFKTQADSFKAWIEQQIADMKTGVSENASYIQTFLQNYSSSDQDLRSLQAGLRTIRQTGPDVQAQYETEKEAQKTEPLDFTPFYSKAGLLAGIVGVVAGVSMLV
jgi:hypothetical protein